MEQDLCTVLLASQRAEIMEMPYLPILPVIFRRKFLIFWKNLLQNLVSLQICKIFLVNILVKTVQ